VLVLPQKSGECPKSLTYKRVMRQSQLNQKVYKIEYLLNRSDISVLNFISPLLDRTNGNIRSSFFNIKLGGKGEVTK